MSGHRRMAVAFAMFTVLPGMSAAAHAEPPSENPVANAPFAEMVADAARRFGLPEAWIWAVVRIESRGNPHAISPAGAMGLMQLMPATYAEMRGRYGLGADPYDPHDNVIAGAAYLRAMYDRYGSPGFLAAYNAGPGRYDEYLTGGRRLPVETVSYLAQLTPMIGSQTGAPATVTPPDPFAWTRAALFAARSTASPADAPTPVKPPTEVAANARPPRDTRAITLPTTGLFIPRSAPPSR